MSSKIFVKVETSLEQQENLRNSRKSLKVLQRTSTDKENLVGRQVIGPQKAFVKSKSENDFNDTSDIKRKKLASHQTPSSHVAAAAATTAAVVKSRRSSELQRITEEDLQGSADSAQLSEGYWRELAEKRRLALDATLTENQELHDINASLKEQLDVSNQMLDESRNLVEILTEMLEEGDAAGAGGFEQGESSKSFLHASIAEEAAEVEGVAVVEDSDATVASPKGDFDADDEDSQDGAQFGRTKAQTTSTATADDVTADKNDAANAAN